MNVGNSIEYTNLIKKDQKLRKVFQIIWFILAFTFFLLQLSFGMIVIRIISTCTLKNSSGNIVKKKKTDVLFCSLPSFYMVKNCMQKKSCITCTFGQMQTFIFHFENWFIFLYHLIRRWYIIIIVFIDSNLQQNQFQVPCFWQLAKEITSTVFRHYNVWISSPILIILRKCNSFLRKTFYVSKKNFHKFF